MKKVLVWASAALLLFTACQEKKSNEKILPADEIEMIGDAFQEYGAAGDVKLFLSQSSADPKQWTVRASFPVQKTGKAKIQQLEAQLYLLDSNNAPVQDGFVLSAQDLDAVLPVLAAEEGAQRNVIFSSETTMDKAAAEKLLAGTQALRLSLSAPNAKPAAAAPQQPAVTFPSNVNLTSLIQFYGLRSLVNEYERAYRSKNKSKMKQIRDRFSSIENKVREHPRGGRTIANNLEDWFDDQLDEVEDRVDDER